MRRSLTVVCMGVTVAVLMLAAPAMATPVADFGFAPADPRVGEPLSLFANGSVCDARPCTYEWSEIAADGTQTYLGSGRSRVVRLATAGESSIVLTVTNRGFRAPPGPTSASVTKAVTVGPPLDTSGPSTTITSGPEEVSAVAEATFTFTSEEGATFECRLDAGAWAACTSPVTLGLADGLTDGPHVFSVRATDALGNVELAEDAYAWTVAALPDQGPAPPEGPDPPDGGPDPLDGLDCQFGWVTFCTENGAVSAAG